MKPGNVSVIITCFNEADRIGHCLESVRGFGEIVVVDSFSTDETLDVAREHRTTIYQRPYRSAADQKNWALRRARHDWVLILDADEALTLDLRSEIETLTPGSVDGFWIRRRSEYLGRIIGGCGWQRDKVLRLFKRSSGRYSELEVHEEVAVAGRADILEHRLEHHPYRDVAHHFDKIEEYSTRGAVDYVTRGGRAAFLNMLVHPPFRFLRMYVLQRGFMDRSQGLILCLLASYSVFLKYAKAWELKWKQRK